MAILKKLIIYRLFLSGISGLILGLFMDYGMAYRVFLAVGGFVYLGVSLFTYLKAKSAGELREKMSIRSGERFMVYSLFLMGVSVLLLGFVIGLEHRSYYFPVLFLGNSIVLLSVYYCWQASRKLLLVPVKS